MSKIYTVKNTNVHLYAYLKNLEVTEEKPLDDITLEDEVTYESISSEMDNVIEDWLSEVLSSGVKIDLDNYTITFYVALNKYAHISKEKVFDLDELIDTVEISNLSNKEKVEFIQDHTEDFLLEWVESVIDCGFNLVLNHNF